MKTPNVTSPAFNRRLILTERSRKSRAFALATLLALIYQMVFPVVSYALTAGPTSPSFSSFEPVATTNMVNEFNGQFVYNIPVLEIPGANGGGYAMSLSYHSGDGPESEASWVGYGWTLNPGSINRTRRGIPDDYKGDNVRYYNEVPRNWTLAATGMNTAQMFSGLLGFGIYNTIRYNNYKGFGFTKSFGLTGLRGLLSVGFHLSDGDGTFSAAVNPAAILSYASDAARKVSQSSGNIATRRNSNFLLNSGGQAMRSSVSGFIGKAASHYCSYLLSDMTSPYNITPYDGSTISGSISLTGDPPPVPIGFAAGLTVAYTSQKNQGDRNVPAYGYMYSGDAKDNDSASNEAMMDYTVENVSTYNPRDKYLPVPSSTPDAYFISGEGVGGAFRMYNDRIGIFSPNYAKSTTKSKMFGLDVHVGMDYGVGGEYLQFGEHSLEVRSSWADWANGNTDDFWFVPYDFKDTLHQISEASFFRFNSDLGGKLTYDGNDKPLAVGAPELPDVKQLVQDDKPTPYGNDSRRNARSSYIGFHTNKEIKQKVNGKRAIAYELNERIHSMAGRDMSVNNSLDNLIGELSVTNDDGNNYVYGLPVYSDEEVAMQHGLPSASSGNYLVNGDIQSSTTKVGEAYSSPYVSSYLLTQITTPDYVDLNLNGPDVNDLGGYTRFTYRNNGNTNKNLQPFTGYKWRSPYTGLYYHPGRLSTKKDNMGSYQSGFRENYYLDTVETKTHYATFVTQFRSDGFGAYNQSDFYAALGRGVGYDGSNTSYYGNMEVLKEIRLYAKKATPSDTDKLIKKVHFDYDYTCWPGTPNSLNTTTLVHEGKLTLKKVWFEYNGVINSYISPYQFQYTYPNVDYPSKYQAIKSELTSSRLNQTPAYTGMLDCWGNYQQDGTNRRNKLICSPNQAPDSGFDPAAWQLKRIILPSGGEIHVQYEQNSYAYVQDRPASMLIPLTRPGDIVNSGDQDAGAKGDEFELNTTAVGLGSSSDKARLVSLINKTCKTGYQKIYFKFLYTLLGENESDVNSCNAEYIDGYADFKQAWIDPTSGNVRVSINTALPRKTCLDFIHKEAGGALMDGNCLPGNNSVSDPGEDEGTLKGIAQQLFNSVKTSLAAKAFACKQINEEMSYLKIPVLKKLGGGVRVKRLMMYNKGIDMGSESLYGNEYIYENELTGESYGVATNEPYENREENPLVEYMDKRSEQSTWQRLFQGRDREQFEGPLSMNALPAASVGYSRIIKKNIHQDKYTGTGFTVVDYFTAKDYPFDGYLAALGVKGADVTEVVKQSGGPGVDIGFFSYSINANLKTAQSYCFIQNQMHGQIKSVADYPGVYDPVKFYNKQQPPTPVTQRSYEYFEPGSQIPMYGGPFNIFYDQPGKEMDITVDRRAVIDEGTETNLTGDITTGFIPPTIFIPYPIAFPITSSSMSQFNSLVTNKVIHYPAIQKRIVTMKDGYVQYTDNIAFDPLTTKPVVTSTHDSYNGLPIGNNGQSHDGTYTTNNFFASSNYRGMGQKSWNERYSYYTNTGQFVGVSGGPTNYTVAAVNAAMVFNPGDLVAFHSNNGIALANVMSLSGNDIIVQPAGRYNNAISTTPEYYKVEIVKSSYNNLLNASMGGFTQYGNIMSFSDKDKFLADMNAAWATVQAGGPGTYVNINMANYNFKLHHWVDPCIWDKAMADSLRIVKLNSTDYDFQIYAEDYWYPPHVAIGAGLTWVSNSLNFYAFPPTSVHDSSFHYPFKPNPGYMQDYGPSYMATIANPNTPGFTFTTPYKPPGWTSGTLPWPPRIIFNDGANVGITGLQVCPTYEANILKATATMYRDDWAYDTTIYGVPAGLNDYETNFKGKWRPFSTYVYNMKVIAGNDLYAGERNYKQAGSVPKFQLDIWSKVVTYNTDNWIRTSLINSYSPHGNATEELDAHNIASTAKFGYRGMLAYAIAQNAHFSAVRFESFENVYPDPNGATGHKVEDALKVYQSQISGEAHTGRRCYTLDANGFQFDNVLDASGKGHIIRYWEKITSSLANSTTNASTIAVTSPSYTLPSPKFVTRTGEWALFEVQTPTISPGSNVTIKFAGSSALIDDIRIQPVESQMTAYVYNTKTYKLSAVLDDQNFATYYQHNGEGKLVRKRLETERGVRTVEEAHYHTPPTAKLDTFWVPLGD